MYIICITIALCPLSNRDSGNGDPLPFCNAGMVMASHLLSSIWHHTTITTTFVMNPPLYKTANALPTPPLACTASGVCLNNAAPDLS